MDSSCHCSSTLWNSCKKIIGKRVYANNTSNANFTVNVAKLHAGLYILKVSDGTYTSIQKVVIK